MAPKKMEILVPGSRTREEILKACQLLNMEPIEMQRIEYLSGQSVWRVKGWFYENSKMHMKDPAPWLP